MRRVPLFWVLAFLIAWTAPAAAGSIDTAFLEGPWPKERVRVTEVHKYAVQWREYLDKEKGMYMGVRFTAPTDHETTWELATANYADVGKTVPGLRAFRTIEDTPERKVIEMDIKILWKEMTLTFEIERQPPDVLRFRMISKQIGQYIAVYKLSEPTGVITSMEPAVTQIEFSTWLMPARPVPMGMLATAERMIFLRMAREFLKACEARYLEELPADAPKPKKPPGYF